MAAQNQAPEAATGRSAKQGSSFRHQGVAAANPLAVEAGYGDAAAGGSAIDAAIATQLVLGLVEPQSSGLGGGAFIVPHDAKTGRTRSYDNRRETVPAAAKPERFIGSDGLPLKFMDAVVGGRAVGVPGTVALLAETHRKAWSFRGASCSSPPLRWQSRVFRSAPKPNMQLKGERFEAPTRRRAPISMHLTVNPWPVGYALKNLEYAATLKAIRDGGAKAFYEGDIAADIACCLRARAQAIPTEDFSVYRVSSATRCAHLPWAARLRHAAAVFGRYRGGANTVIGRALPVGGVEAKRPDSLHVFAEAGRLCLPDRNRYLADPDFVAIPRGMLDAAYLNLRGSRSTFRAA